MPKITFSISTQQCFADIITCGAFGNLFPLNGNRFSKCCMCRLMMNSTNSYCYMFCVLSASARIFIKRHRQWKKPYMLCNICCGFTKTQHKSSRKISQKTNRVYAAVLKEPQHILHLFLIKSRLHSYSTFKTHENIFYFLNAPYFDICSFLSSSSSIHENLLFFVFVFFFFFNL